MGADSLIVQYIGTDAEGWAIGQAWEAALRLTRQECPHILDTGCEAGRIHELALLQRLTDFAVWSRFCDGRNGLPGSLDDK